MFLTYSVDIYQEAIVNAYNIYIYDYFQKTVLVRNAPHSREIPKTNQLFYYTLNKNGVNFNTLK